MAGRIYDNIWSIRDGDIFSSGPAGAKFIYFFFIMTNYSASVFYMFNTMMLRKKREKGERDLGSDRSLVDKCLIGKCYAFTG